MEKKTIGLVVSGALLVVAGNAHAQMTTITQELAEKCKTAITAAPTQIPQECKVFVPGGAQTMPSQTYPLPQGVPMQAYPQDLMKNIPQQQGMSQQGQGYMSPPQEGFRGGAGQQAPQMPQGIGEEQLRQMKYGAKAMERNIGRIEKRLAALEAKGIMIDATTTDAVAKIKDIIVKVNAAQSAEDMVSVDMGDFGDLMQTVNEGMQKAEMAAQFPRILKEADRELARQAAYLKKADARAVTLGVNVGSLLQEWHALADQMTKVRNEAKAGYDAGDTESAIEMLREDFFGKMDEVNRKRGAYEMLANMTRMLKSADREIAAFGRKADRLEQAGEDVTKAREYIDQAQKKIADIRALAKGAEIDEAALIDDVEELMEVKNEIADELAAIGGQIIGTKLPQIPGLQNFKTFEAPQGFDVFMQGQMPQGVPIQRQQGVPAGTGSQPGQQMQPGGQGAIMLQQGNVAMTIEDAIATLKAKVEQLIKDANAAR